MAGNTTKKLTLVVAGDNKGGVAAVDGIGKSVGKLQSQLGGLGTGIGGALSLGAITAFANKAVDGYAQVASAVAVTNRLTGVGAENASLLAFAAQQSGVDATKAAASWGIFASNIKNGKVAAQGIATKDGNGKLRDFGDILNDTADKLASLPAGFQRTAAARALFGRGGADMVKILAGGSQAIEDLRGKMEALGLEFDDAGLKKYQKFLQSQRDVSAAMSGLQVEIGEQVIPVIERVDHAVVGAVERFQKLPGPVQASIEVVGGLAVALTGLSVVTGVLGPLFERTIGYATSAAGAFQGVASSTGEVAATTPEMVAAQSAASEAFIAEAVAANDLVVALRLVGATEEEVAIATGTLTVAETEAAATTGLFASGLAGLAQAAPLAAVGLYDVHKGASQIVGSTDQLTKALTSLGKGGTDVSAVLKQVGADSNPDLLFDVEHYKANFTAINKSLTAILGSEGPAVAKKSYDTLSAALTATGVSAADVKRQFGPFLVALGAASGATEDQAKQTEYGAEAFDHYKKKLDESTDALKRHTAAGQSLFDARQGLVSANDDVTSSLTDMASAEADANGTSDEAVAASQAITDAQHDEAKARQDVVDLQVAATEAQGDLNKERQDAVKRIDDLAEANRKAAQSERDATLALHEAQAENRKVLADPRSSALDRERASVGLADAKDNAASATRDHVKAIEEENTAKARGVEGDAQVVAAKKKVADAQQAIVDGEGKVNEAHRKVSEAVAARSKFEEAAILKVRDAHDKVNVALLNQVVANAKVVESQYGVVAGDLALRDGLDKLTAQLAPGSPLSVNTIAWAESVAAALRGFDSRRSGTGQVTGITRPQSFGEDTPVTPAPGTPGSAIPPTRPDGPSPRSIAKDAKTRAISGGVTLNQTNIFQGTTKANQRMHEQSTRKVLNDHARRTR